MYVTNTKTTHNLPSSHATITLGGHWSRGSVISNLASARLESNRLFVVFEPEPPYTCTLTVSLAQNGIF